MKKTLPAVACLAAALTLGGCGGHPGAETMEVPGYPWDYYPGRADRFAHRARDGLYRGGKQD